MRITGAGGLWVQAAVPQTWAGQLRAGGAATVLASGSARAGVPATVLDPGLEANPLAGSLRVVLAVSDPVDWLVPGMSVFASIAAGAERDALVVPDAAIVDGAGESLVFASYQASLEGQFELIWSKWMRRSMPGEPANQRDALVGRVDGGREVALGLDATGKPRHVSTSARFARSVAGEYFLLPTIPLLRALAGVPG
jgi:hypothetical protein